MVAWLIAPCKDCPDREVGCHSVCEKYLRFRKLKDEQNAEFAKNANNNRIQNEIARRRIQLAVKGQLGRRRNEN